MHLASQVKAYVAMRFCNPKHYRTLGVKMGRDLKQATDCLAGNYQFLDNDGLAVPAGGRVLGLGLATRSCREQVMMC